MRDELETVTMPLLYEHIQCICYINTAQAGDEGNKVHHYAKEVGLHACLLWILQWSESELEKEYFSAEKSNAS